MRGDQIGLALRHLRLVLLHAQDGQRADLHALLVLVELRLGQVQRFLLHLHVLLRKDEFVIGVDDRGDGGDELLAQALLGIFQPVFGDANVQPRAVNPEIFQQRLGDLEGDRPEVVMKPEAIVGPDVTVRNVAAEIIWSSPTGVPPLKPELKLFCIGHRPGG